MHSLEIVQWDSTRWDHPGYLRRVSGSGLVTDALRRKTVAALSLQHSDWRITADGALLAQLRA